MATETNLYAEALRQYVTAVKAASAAADEALKRLPWWAWLARIKLTIMHETLQRITLIGVGLWLNADIRSRFCGEDEPDEQAD